MDIQIHTSKSENAMAKAKIKKQPKNKQLYLEKNTKKYELHYHQNYRR